MVCVMRQWHLRLVGICGFVTGGDSKDMGVREAISFLQITLACTSGGQLGICDQRGLERGRREGSYLCSANHTGVYVWWASGDL